MSSSQSTSKWTKEEDEKLLAAVEKFGGKQWKLVAEMVGTRNQGTFQLENLIY